jgi:hypothetical protein
VWADASWPGLALLKPALAVQRRRRAPTSPPPQARPPRATGGAARSRPVRPGRVGPSPPPLSRSRPHRAAGGACSALPHLAGVGRAPSAICLRLSAGLLAGALVT